MRCPKILPGYDTEFGLVASNQWIGFGFLTASNWFFLSVGFALILCGFRSFAGSTGETVEPAYNQPWQITSYATDAELTRQRVFDIAFTPDGTAWLAADDGLRRFDGYRWERFDTNAGLPSTFTRAVCVTAEGQLWVGSDAGAGSFDFRNRKYNPQGSKAGLANSNVREIDEDADGSLWFSCDQWPGSSTNAGGLTRLQNGHWQSYGRADGLPMDYVIGYFRDSTGRQFALTPHGWVQRQGERWLPPANPGYNAEDCVLHLAEGKAGVLFAQGEHGLLVLTNGEWKSCGNRSRLVAATRQGEVVAMEYNPTQGQLWFSRWNGHEFVRMSALVSCPANARFYHLREAPDGSLWCVGFGTVVRWAYRSGKWTFYPQLPPPVASDKSGRIWFADESNVVVRAGGEFGAPFHGRFQEENGAGTAMILDPDRNTLLVTDPDNPAAGTPVESGCETMGGVRSDGDDGFWIYGQDKNNAGVVAHYRRGKTVIITPPEFSDRQLISATAEPHRGLWVVAQRKGTVEYGVALVTDDRIDWQKFNPAPPPLMYPSWRIGGGRFWLSSYSGVYEPAAAPIGAWNQVTAIPPGGIEWSLTGSNEVLFTFGGGRSGHPGCALFSQGRWNVVYGDYSRPTLGPDGTTIYLLSHGGLFVRRKPGTLDLEYLSTPGVAFVHGAIADLDGTLWLSTSEGSLHYQPSRTPPATRISAGSTEVRRGAPLLVAFQGVGRFEKGDFPANFRYSWRIDGGNWTPFVSWPGQSLALPELGAGKHRLEVRTRDLDGNVDPSPAALEFTVLPVPLQQRTWFMPAVLLLAGLMAWLVWLGIDRTRQIARSNTALRGEIAIRRQTEVELQQARAQLERRVAERTAELTQANESLNHEIAERRHAEESRQKLEEQLQQARKMEAIGTLAGGIAHDFNNILAVIIPYSHLALEETADHPKFQEYLKQILVAADRAKNLVQQILAFSRRQRQERQIVDLQPVVTEALKLLRSALPSTIEIIQRFSPTPPVLADPTQLHQVMMNLCTNAEHAMRGRPGRLEVALEPKQVDEAFAKLYPDLLPGRYACLSVRDNGCGIPDELLNRIFEPFFTTKEQGQGTGLGLSVVHGIVKSHDGVILVQSWPDQGTEFQIFLPIQDKSRMVPPPAAKPAPSGSGQHILLVDDEPSISVVLGQMLSRAGYHVTAHTDPHEALKAFLSRPAEFDLLFTDLTMPGMTGVELAREIFKVRPDLPVILTTGFGGDVVADAITHTHILKVLEKPVPPGMVNDIVYKILRNGGNTAAHLPE